MRWTSMRSLTACRASVGSSYCQPHSLSQAPSSTLTAGMRCSVWISLYHILAPQAQCVTCGRGELACIDTCQELHMGCRADMLKSA